MIQTVSQRIKFKVHSFCKQSAQGPCFNKLTTDVSSGYLGKVWWGEPCFHKLKIVQTHFTKQMDFSRPNSIVVLALIPPWTLVLQGLQYGVHVWKCWPTTIPAMPRIQAVIHNASQGVQFGHSNFSWVTSLIPQLPKYGAPPLFPTEPHYGVHIWMCWPTIIAAMPGFQAVIHHVDAFIYRLRYVQGQT